MLSLPITNFQIINDYEGLLGDGSMPEVAIILRAPFRRILHCTVVPPKYFEHPMHDVILWL